MCNSKNIFSIVYPVHSQCLRWRFSVCPMPGSWPTVVRYFKTQYCKEIPFIFLKNLVVFVTSILKWFIFTLLRWRWNKYKLNQLAIDPISWNCVSQCYIIFKNANQHIQEKSPHFFSHNHATTLTLQSFLSFPLSVLPCKSVMICKKIKSIRLNLVLCFSSENYLRSWNTP